MPIYEYCCKDCEQIFEEWQRNHDEVEVPCPVCGGEAHRIISNTSFVLKGTGWYVTDYANGRSAAPSGASPDGAPGAKGNGEAKSEGSSGGSEAKSDSGASPASGGSEAKSEASVPPASGRSCAPKADSSPAQS